MTERGKPEDQLGRAIDEALKKIARGDYRTPRVNIRGYDSLREHDRYEKSKQEKAYQRAGCIGALIVAGVLSIPLLSLGASYLYNTTRSYLRPLPVTENVIGNSDPEEYITLYGKRYYSKIDEISLETYFVTEPTYPKKDH